RATRISSISARRAPLSSPPRSSGEGAPGVYPLGVFRIGAVIREFFLTVRRRGCDRIAWVVTRDCVGRGSVARTKTDFMLRGGRAARNGKGAVAGVFAVGGHWHVAITWRPHSRSRE